MAPSSNGIFSKMMPEIHFHIWWRGFLLCQSGSCEWFSKWENHWIPWSCTYCHSTCAINWPFDWDSGMCDPCQWVKLFVSPQVIAGCDLVERNVISITEICVEPSRYQLFSFPGWNSIISPWSDGLVFLRDDSIMLQTRHYSLLPTGYIFAVDHPWCMELQLLGWCKAYFLVTMATLLMIILSILGCLQ